MNEGIKISVSNDDPGFFGYDGVTLDYLALVLSWDLGLKELK